MSGERTEPSSSPTRDLTSGWRGPSVARATYGLVVAMSVLAVWSEEHDPDGADVLESLAGTAIIFWLAHVYAAITEAMTLTRRRPTKVELRAIMVHEWPIVEVAVLPTVIMVLSVVGVLDTSTAINLALGACMLELAATGILATVRTGARGWALILLGGASVALGLAVVALKTLTH